MCTLIPSAKYLLNTYCLDDLKQVTKSNKWQQFESVSTSVTGTSACTSFPGSTGMNKLKPSMTSEIIKSNFDFLQMRKEPRFLEVTASQTLGLILYIVHLFLTPTDTFSLPPSRF